MTEKMEVEVSGSVSHKTAPHFKVELTRGLKGTYGWTVSAGGGDPDIIIFRINQLNEKLLELYPTQKE
jgi:hypothetical protein